MNDESGSTSSSLFEQHKRRLDYLELWRELAIRPSEHDCDPQDLGMFRRTQDDCDELTKKCLEARRDMNDAFPPHELAMDNDLQPSTSAIEDAGQGLFFCPSSGHFKICRDEVICYYCGHLHSFLSAKYLQDKSYLMLVANDLLVDPGPLPNIKARYINDPLNEAYWNCKFVPEPDNNRCAVVAIRDIHPKEELFVSYGEAYWANQDYRGTVYHGQKVHFKS